MANEAVLREKPVFYFPCDFTVADATAITKGSLLQLTDPRTASAVSGTTFTTIFAGIAARDKIASDGLTQLAVYQLGIFDVYLSGGCSAGQSVGSAGSVYPNHVAVVNSGAISVSGAGVLGQTLQAGVNGDQIQVRLLLA